MDNENSTSHIKDNEVQFYYDKIFQKISLNIRDIYNTGEYAFLGQEGMYISIVMFEKFKIQFYSAVSLAYKCTQNPLNQFEYLDIASIHAIIRSCYETFLTFRYIFMQPEAIGKYKINVDLTSRKAISLNFKILLYKCEGYRQSFQGFSSMPEEKEKNKKLYLEFKSEVLKNEIYIGLSDKQKEDILVEWRPSWNEIASMTELSLWNSKNMYNLLSQHSHNSYTSLMLLDHYYRNLDEYNRDSMLVQLFEFTAILINDYIKLFKLNHNILDKDEIAILNEFYGFAHVNPNDNIFMSQLAEQKD